MPASLTCHDSLPVFFPPPGRTTALHNADFHIAKPPAIKRLFPIRQHARRVHNAGGDNFRPVRCCVHGNVEDKVGAVQVCPERIVGRQRAQADTCSRSKHLPAASICSCNHICVSCYQPESVSVSIEVQNNATAPTHSLLGPFAARL